MIQADPYRGLSLSDRPQMRAFAAELAHLPRSLISGIWEVARDRSGSLLPRQHTPFSYLPLLHQLLLSDSAHRPVIGVRPS